eukprot:4250234-Pyramimonas_sp.AAC.1
MRRACACAGERVHAAAHDGGIAAAEPAAHHGDSGHDVFAGGAVAQGHGRARGQSVAQGAPQAPHQRAGHAPTGASSEIY